MAWRRLHVVSAVVAAVWLGGCGGSSDNSEGDLTNGNQGGSGGSGQGGSSQSGGSGGSGPQGGIGGGNVAGSAQGGSGVAGSGGSGGSGVAGSGGSGVAGSGVAGSGGSGVAGSGPACPGEVPAPGAVCPPDLSGQTCTYQSANDCGPVTFCQCSAKGSWLCAQTDGPPCVDCQAPAQAGGKCEKDGLGCSDACGNACKCDGNTWFCAGTCTNTCAPGASCTGDAGCAYQEGDCSVSCQCTSGGTLACSKVCGNACAPGGPCTPGKECVGKTPDGCEQLCQCNKKGSYDCAVSCPTGCPADGAFCGGGCSSPGQSCTCAGDFGPIPCTCEPGPTDKLSWSCGGTGQCSQGQPCNSPGSGCATADPSGCTTSCTCSPKGFLECSKSCPGSCPDKPAFCGEPCAGAAGQVCKCFEGDVVVPCTCGGSSAKLTWACEGPVDPCQQGGKCIPGNECKTPTPEGCTQYCACGPEGLYQCKNDCPTNPCSPGAKCVPGNVCEVPQGQPGCTLACKCSAGGLYQCSASCSGSGGCPDQPPAAGTKCGPEATVCDYGNLTCFCKGGAWICTDG